MPRGTTAGRGQTRRTPERAAPARPPLGYGAEGDRIPKYVQLAAALREKIRREEYRPGQQIPTEEGLGREYQVSRITVREALNRLVQEGLLQRRQGKGTYVAPHRLRRDLAKLYSFSHDMARLGLQPSSRVLECAVAPADPEELDRLRLSEGERRVTRIVRLRLADGNPILIETTAIPLRLCPDLVEVDLATGSLYEALTGRYRLSPRTAEETYEATVLPAAEARLLRCERGRPAAALTIRRTTFLEDGTPIEYTRAVGRGDRLTLALNLAADKAEFERRVGL